MLSKYINSLSKYTKISNQILIKLMDLLVFTIDITDIDISNR